MSRMRVPSGSTRHQGDRPTTRPWEGAAAVVLCIPPADRRFCRSRRRSRGCPAAGSNRTNWSRDLVQDTERTPRLDRRALESSSHYHANFRRSRELRRNEKSSQNRVRANWAWQHHSFRCSYTRHVSRLSGPQMRLNYYNNDPPIVRADILLSRRNRKHSSLLPWGELERGNEYTHGRSGRSREASLPMSHDHKAGKSSLIPGRPSPGSLLLCSAMQCRRKARVCRGFHKC
jgi:hypothetical protein